MQDLGILLAYFPCPQNLCIISCQELFFLSSQCPFHFFLCISQDSLEKHNEVGMVAGIEVMHESPLTTADLAMATAECPVCQQQRLTLRSLYDSEIMSYSPGGKLITLGQFRHGRASI